MKGGLAPGDARRFRGPSLRGVQHLRHDRGERFWIIEYMTITHPDRLRHADEGVSGPNRLGSRATALESGRRGSPKEGVPGDLALPLIDEDLGVDH